MNPIWRVAHEMSKSRSETQKRNQRRRTAVKQRNKLVKEQQRQEYLDRDRRRYVLGEENQSARTVEQNEDEEESGAEKFQKELCWCIEQLEIGLLNPKATKLQRQETEKILRTLKSSKAPMAKKRQVMHATFGDYRTKMQDEKKKHAAAMKKGFIKPAETSQNQVGRFLRRASSVNKEDAGNILSQQNGESQEKDVENEKATDSINCRGDAGDKNKQEDKSVDGETRHNRNASGGQSSSRDRNSEGASCGGTFKFEFDIKPENDSGEESDKLSSHEKKQDTEKVDKVANVERSKVHSQTPEAAATERTDSCQREASIENASLQKQMEGMCFEAAEN